jgi:MFS family permease
MIIVFGKIADHLRNDGNIMTLGYGLISLSTLGYYFVSNPFDLLIVQVILGVGMAAITPSFDTLYSSGLSKKSVGFEWGLWEGLAQIFTGISAIAGGFIAAFLGFKTLFLVMFAISLISIAISIKEFTLKKYQ